MYHVLFLCTGNSARSIMAEAILNRLGAGRFQAHSAGSHPRGDIHPRTLELLKRLKYSAEAYRSKSWDEFAQPGAPHLDFVFTVCDQAAQEVCPIWPGQPMTAHWGVPDPAAATGTDAEIGLAFSEAYRQLDNRISIFLALPLARLDRLALKKAARRYRQDHGLTAMPSSMARGIVAEAIGTALLLAAVVGSGIMAERLAGGNAAVALLANAVATGGALIALIVTFGPISGAHFNPVVTLALAVRRDVALGRAAAYIAAQCIGAVAGVWLAHAMFSLPILQISAHARGTFGELIGEFVATFGLLGLILSCVRHAPAALPYAVAAYITGAYWFTSSTSFANPAVTMARALTDTFAGIAPAHVPGFIVAELAGGVAAMLLFGWLDYPPSTSA